MAKQFELLSPHYEAIEVTLGSDAVAGNFVTSGNTNGFYLVDGVSGDKAGIVVDAEIVKVAKTTGESWASGAVVYWNATAKKATTSASGNTLIGYAVEPALSADTEGTVNFDGDASFLKA